MMNEKEKTTVPIPSVGADGEQSLSYVTNEIITTGNEEINPIDESMEEMLRQMQRMSDPSYLATMTMSQLYDIVYESRLPVIDGLLYPGTYLFVGSPKIGKSFFMAQIGYHISKGLPLWGFSVRQGTVLYLALEDDYARLQKRLSQMFGMEGSENFYFATKSKSLNAGLEQQLVQFVTDHKDARLIIIDTLQKVREVGGDKFSYASDYEIVTKLKAFSDHYGICFLVVHHTRKMESSDSFDMISGTNGLLGAADGAFVMQKNNLQDIFLTKVRKQSLPVTVFLMNGFQMRGSVTGFDSFTVVLDTDGRQQVIYKHAISTIVPLHPVALYDPCLPSEAQ